MILLEKLEIYGFEIKEILWMKSYLTERRQQVYVDGSLSDPQDLQAGVPQGSILGPLLYIIFTNDLPEVIHDHLSANNTFFNTSCKSCGSICCFADDSTYSKSGKDVDKIKEDIQNKFQEITIYMARNKLILNSNKTHLLVMTSDKMHKKHDNFGINLDTGQEVIEPVEHEKLLGAQVSNDFKFDIHIRNNKKSMINILTSRINALRKVAFVSSFKNRKMIAKGIIISTILYIITLYGSCNDYLLSCLQIVQNSAARCVTRLSWNTAVSVLLQQCGWLSVRQMVFYHTMVQVFKIKQDGKPVYLYNKLSQAFNYRTRLASSNGIRETEKIKSDLRKKGFVHRSTLQWNSLPLSLKNEKKQSKFKNDLRSWVKENVNT